MNAASFPSFASRPDNVGVPTRSGRCLGSPWLVFPNLIRVACGGPQTRESPLSLVAKSKHAEGWGGGGTSSRGPFGAAALLEGERRALLGRTQREGHLCGHRFPIAHEGSSLGPLFLLEGAAFLWGWDSPGVAAGSLEGSREPGLQTRQRACRERASGSE